MSNTIKVHDKVFEPYIDKKQISQIVKRLAKEVENDYKNEQPIFYGILNGAVIFMSDFLREYNSHCEISFVRLKSYQGTESTGEPEVILDVYENIENRTVIILEDIIDTGTTLEKIYELFQKKNPREIKIVSLFLKPDVYKKSLAIYKVGMEIPNEFVVGYGLDYDQLGRNLKSIYKLKK